MRWLEFNVFVVAMLFLDLVVFHRTSHEVKVREALLWSAFWIALSLAFNVGVYYVKGPDAALKFLTGYLLEKSLSVDNLFVFLLIFSYFRVPAAYQHKVLFWGIVGALVMRAAFIFCGVALIRRFHWVIWVMGLVLVASGVKLFFESDKEIHPEKNIAIRLFRKLFPSTEGFERDRFMVRRNGRWLVTPLLAVLITIETTDIIFAMDSIPAILAISTDPFIVYTSNVFAILGLRALYFALAGMMELFHLLHYGLGFILAFVGLKMLISEYVHVPVSVALGVIGATLLVCVVASILFPRRAA